MSVFTTHVSPPRFSVIRVLAVSAVLTGAFFLAQPDSPSTANVSGLVPRHTEVLEATTFAQPVAVQWEGRVTRTLAGGRGLEIRSPDAQGGYFFAYDESGFPASVSESPVLVRGLWLGISCEYGRCAPEVEADFVQALPIELE